MEEYYFSRSGNRTLCWYKVKPDMGVCGSGEHEDPEEAKKLAYEDARAKAQVIPIKNLALYHWWKKRGRYVGARPEGPRGPREAGRLMTSHMEITDLVRKNESTDSLVDIMLLHQKCDWGDVTELEKAKNDAVFKRGFGKIIGRYNTSTGNVVLLVTEMEKSLVTVMYPDEYPG